MKKTNTLINIKIFQVCTPYYYNSFWNLIINNKFIIKLNQETFGKYLIMSTTLNDCPITQTNYQTKIIYWNNYLIKIKISVF